MRKGKGSRVEKWMERAHMSGGEESTLACPMLIYRELVDPVQCCSAWGMGRGGRKSKAQGAWGHV